MTLTRPNSDAAVSESVAFRCDFADGRAAAKRLREFLAAQGVPEPELFSCELALTEACNNAVQHVGERGRSQTNLATVRCDATRLEFIVTDHTDGFEWPTGPLQPPGAEAEHGRGVFIIRSVMDGAEYHRGNGENTLRMWKLRASDRRGAAEAG